MFIRILSFAVVLILCSTSGYAQQVFVSFGQGVDVSSSGAADLTVGTGSIFIYSAEDFDIDAFELIVSTSDDSVIQFRDAEIFNSQITVNTDLLGFRWFDESEAEVLNTTSVRFLGVAFLEYGIAPSLAAFDEDFDPLAANPDGRPGGSFLLGRVDYDIVGPGTADITLETDRLGFYSYSTPDDILFPTFGWGTLTVTGTQAQVEVTKSSRTITIDGTRFDDEVTVSLPSDNVVRVLANGQITEFPCPTDGAAAPLILFFGSGGADDFLNQTPLAAVAYGGSGPDRLVATTGPAFFFGEGGADFIVGSSVADMLDGGLGADEIFGFEGSDDIVAGGGADYIVGGSGNDTISGGLGADTIYGQDGADVIQGGNGEDYISGGSENDFIEGGSNDDQLLGGTSDDTIIGGLGDDLMIGGSGGDVLCGGRGDDELRGGAGNDSLFGEEGVDVLLGGTGVDDLDQDSPGSCAPSGLAVGS